MHIHRFKIDEAEQRPKSGVIHHLRRFLTVYRGTGDSGEQLFAGHLETIIRRPEARFSVRFHVGTAGSETPFDGHLVILGSGIYWGTENGRRLASRITREKRHQYEGRDLALRVDDGRLSISAWVHPGSWERGEFSRWRSASVSFNILDKILGPKRYTYEDLDWALIAIEMPEGTYPVRATLQTQRFGRAKTKRKVESLVVDVNAPKGIPSHFDHSGGWKGDRTHGFAVPLRERRKDWHFDAQNAITAWVYEQRARTGFREAQPANAD